MMPAKVFRATGFTKHEGRVRATTRVGRIDINNLAGCVVNDEARTTDFLTVDIIVVPTHKRDINALCLSAATNSILRLCHQKGTGMLARESVLIKPAHK
jgi:hypothetical protein